MKNQYKDIEKKKNIIKPFLSDTIDSNVPYFLHSKKKSSLFFYFLTKYQVVSTCPVKTWKPNRTFKRNWSKKINAYVFVIALSIWYWLFYLSSEYQNDSFWQANITDDWFMKRNFLTDQETRSIDIYSFLKDWCYSSNPTLILTKNYCHLFELINGVHYHLTNIKISLPANSQEFTDDTKRHQMANWF